MEKKTELSVRVTKDELVTIRRCVADYAGNENFARRTEWIESAKALVPKIEAALGKEPAVSSPPASVQQVITRMREVAATFEKVATFDANDEASIVGHSACRVLESFAVQLAALYAP